MATLTNSFGTYNAEGNREELANAIYRISPEETPFVSVINQGRCTSAFPEWQTDALTAAGPNAVVQGNVDNANPVNATTRYGNRTQISEKRFAITGTQEAVDKAGRRSEVAYQQAKSMVELKRDVEFGALQNGKAEIPGAANAGQARGVLGWLATNTSKGGGGGADPDPTTGGNTAPVDGTLRNFTEALLKTVAQAVWTSGGNPTLMFVPAALRSKVSAFTGAAGTKFENVRVKRITATAEIYVGDFGRYNIVNSRYQRARDVFLIDPKMWDLLTLRPMKAEPLAKTGDAEAYLVNTEWTLKARNEAANGAIRDLQ